MQLSSADLRPRGAVGAWTPSALHTGPAPHELGPLFKKLDRGVIDTESNWLEASAGTRTGTSVIPNT